MGPFHPEQFGSKGSPTSGRGTKHQPLGRCYLAVLFPLHGLQSPVMCHDMKVIYAVGVQNMWLGLLQDFHILQYKPSDTVCHLFQSFLTAAATKVHVLEISGNFIPLIPTPISNLSLSQLTYSRFPGSRSKLPVQTTKTRVREEGDFKHFILK